jgi:hypothetical protein
MKNTIIVLLAVLALGVSGQVLAGHDQSLNIVLDDGGCVAEIVTQGPDNCADGTPDRGACQGQKDCACGSKGKWVNWTIEGGKAFSIEFPGGSPFKGNCTIDNPSPNGKGCKISNSAQSGASFKYDVLVEDCPAYDPVIIVR